MFLSFGRSRSFLAQIQPKWIHPLLFACTSFPFQSTVENTPEDLSSAWSKVVEIFCRLNIYLRLTVHFKACGAHSSSKFWWGSLSPALSAILSVSPTLLMTAVSQGCNCQTESMAALPPSMIRWWAVYINTFSLFQCKCQPNKKGNMFLVTESSAKKNFGWKRQ